MHSIMVLRTEPQSIDTDIIDIQTSTPPLLQTPSVLPKKSANPTPSQLTYATLEPICKSYHNTKTPSQTIQENKR